MEQEKRNRQSAKGYYDSAMSKYYFGKSFKDKVNGCADYRKAMQLGYQLKEGSLPKLECYGSSKESSYYKSGVSFYFKDDYRNSISL